MDTFIIFDRSYGGLSLKNPWAGIGMLTHMHSKLARKLNFCTFEAMVSSYVKS